MPCLFICGHRPFNPFSKCFAYTRWILSLSLKGLALWWASQPCTCVSPGWIPAHCIWLDSTWHFIWAWCISNPCIFLHFFPHGHIVIMVRGRRAWFVSDWSVLMGISFSPPLSGSPGGCSFIFLSIASFWHPQVANPDMLPFVVSPHHQVVFS